MATIYKTAYLSTLALSILVFILSFFFDAFSTTNGTKDPFTALLMGWMLFFQSTANFAWFYNLLLVCSWVAIVLKPKVALLITPLGLTIGLLPVFFKKIAVDESGTLREITSLDTGYWLWITSIVIVLIGSVLLSVIKRNKQG